MKIVGRFGRDDLATVFIAEDDAGRRFEFTESVQPPEPREKKWVQILSTSFGCPIGCCFCDAGGEYHGPLTARQMLWQIETLIAYRFGDDFTIPPKWKIQFARMGEPSLNPEVLSVLRRLPELYGSNGLLPCISTIAPASRTRFFSELRQVRKELYPSAFQLQFSVHSTDGEQRRKLIPAKTWSLAEMGRYGEGFFVPGGRKVTLNFALGQENALDERVLLKHFDPARFLIKLTPLNPTYRARENRLKTRFEHEDELSDLTERIQAAGYDVIVSVGELEENRIGSNCGQYISAMEREESPPDNAYTYRREPV